MPLLNRFVTFTRPLACLPHGRSVVSPSGRWPRHFPPNCSYLSRSRQASSIGPSVFYF